MKPICSRALKINIQNYCWGIYFLPTKVYASVDQLQVMAEHGAGFSGVHAFELMLIFASYGYVLMRTARLG